MSNIDGNKLGDLFTMDEAHLDIWQMKAKRRAEDLIEILKQVKTIEENELKGICQIRNGMTKYTTARYLEALEAMGMIRREKIGRKKYKVTWLEKSDEIPIAYRLEA